MPSDLTRPIIGIENRTAQEVFDIMCDRFRMSEAEAEALSRTGAVKVLDPDMPAQEMRLHMGEMTAQEMRTARAAIRWANTRLSALEPAAAEGGQEAAAWQSQDLIESVSYVSKNFGLVRYEGIDRYFGQSTHKFSTGHGARYVLPEALNDFLSPKPVARPEEQAVTEAARSVLEWYERDGSVGGAVEPFEALKAAMEAGRHD